MKTPVVIRVLVRSSNRARSAHPVVAIGLALSLGMLPAQALDKAEPIAARVNGQPIYRSEVDRSIPDNVFAATADDTRETILNRLIVRSEIRQYLDAHKIAVADAEIDRTYKYLEAFPPTMGCPCHRYPSLDLYLKMNDYTTDDFRKDLRNQIGFARVLDNAWTESYPTKARRDALIAERRARLEIDYTHAWHIFFNTYPLPTEHRDPTVVKSAARARAEAAWQRLQRGESFDAVAKSASEDQVSAAQGGALGFLRKSNYGKGFEDALTTLKPGEVSRPVESVLGFHIIKWQPIPDEELIAIAKADFLRQKSQSTIAAITSTAKVTRN